MVMITTTMKRIQEIVKMKQLINLMENLIQQINYQKVHMLMNIVMIVNILQTVNNHITLKKILLFHLKLAIQQKMNLKSIATILWNL